MKSYLTLIPISAKVHKCQNRMTLFCIIIAVFLVTTVFGIADTSVQMEKNRLLERHGNWHITLSNLSESDEENISGLANVGVTSWHDVINYDMNQNYKIEEKKVVISGGDEAYITKIWNGLEEGTYPKKDTEIMLSLNAKYVLNVKIGDQVTLKTPAGNLGYTISGFGVDDRSFNNQTYVISAFVNRAGFENVKRLNSSESTNPLYYVQFKSNAKVKDAVQKIESQFGVSKEQIAYNTGLLAITGLSNNSAMKNLYSIAVVLFILILIAGVLMISGSINSNVAQRTKFFGMLRCIGASKQQIIRFVRLEALNWCKTAISVGVILGILVTWTLCAALRFGIGGEFSEMPLFRLSGIGIISGVVVGIVTVLLAAQSPAKRAAKASPVAAASGGQNQTGTGKNGVKIRFAKIETALGIHHALSEKKNLLLMTGSFGLSIILFLAFCTGLDLAHVLLPSLRPWQPDCSIIGYENASTVDQKLVDEIGKMPGVTHVFGNKYASHIAIESDKDLEYVDLVSYDNYMLHYAKDSIISGDISKVSEDSNYVLTIYNKNNPLQVGDTIRVNGEERIIAGVLSEGLFSDNNTIVCSEESFTRLLGEQDYSMINIQVSNHITNGQIEVISALAGDKNIFSDLRETNKESNSTFWAFRIFAYSFLAIISMITVFNIINSTSMSVSARIKQYGAMRAVGMSQNQLTKMIAAEVITYGICGCMAGCVLGIPLNRFLYEKIITTHFGIPWKIPMTQIVVILLMVMAAVIAAIYAPAKRMKQLEITDTINEL